MSYVDAITLAFVCLGGLGLLVFLVLVVKALAALIEADRE